MGGTLHPPRQQAQTAGNAYYRSNEPGRASILIEAMEKRRDDGYLRRIADPLA
jgi:hypothetical protein